MSVIKLIILLALAVVVSIQLATFLWYGPRFHANTTLVATDTNQQLTEKISKKVSLVGMESAYQQVLLESQSFSINQKHWLGHVLGELIFLEKDLDGLSICTSDFSFGCYHSFFLSAVGSRGKAVVPMLGQYCDETFGLPPASLGCQHGIGHGLGEYFGPDRLLEQLEVCRELSWKGIYQGCSSGAFMENNFQTVISEGVVGTQLRDLNEENVFQPCDELTENQYRASCFFELPDYWLTVTNEDSKLLDVWCDELAGSDRVSCYQGLGFSSYQHQGFEYVVASQTCLGLAKSSDRDACISGFAWALFVMPETQSTWLRPCLELAEDSDWCRNNADFNGKLFSID